MKKIINITAYFFIGVVAILTVISILGVWDMLAEDTVRKSFQSIATLGVAALVVMFSAKYFDDKKNKENTLDTKPTLVFKKIRQITIVLLISIVTIVAFVGILAIWDVFNSDVVGRSFGTMAISVFSSFIIVTTCLYREKAYQ